MSLVFLKWIHSKQPLKRRVQQENTEEEEEEEIEEEEEEEEEKEEDSEWRVKPKLTLQHTTQFISMQTKWWHVSKNNNQK